MDAKRTDDCRSGSVPPFASRRTPAGEESVRLGVDPRRGENAPKPAPASRVASRRRGVDVNPRLLAGRQPDGEAFVRRGALVLVSGGELGIGDFEHTAGHATIGAPVEDD